MTTERRWRDEGAGPEIEELLESAALDEPTPQALEGLRSRVAFLFPIPPGGGGGPPDGGPGGPGGPGGAGPGGAGAGGGAAAGAAGAGTVAAGLTKTLLAAAAVSLGVVGVSVGLSRRDEPLPVVSAAPVAIPAPVVVPVPPEPAPEPPQVDAPSKPPPPPPVVTRVPARPAPVAAEPPPKEAPPPPPPAAAGDEELELLQEAMSASSPEVALATAERHLARFPGSPMAQEREVIAVEALVKLGRLDAARTRAERFRAQWPTSTHLVRLETLLRGP